MVTWPLPRLGVEIEGNGRADNAKRHWMNTSSEAVAETLAD